MPRNAVTPGKVGHFWTCLVPPGLCMEKKQLFKKEEIRIQAPSLTSEIISGIFCTTLEWCLQKQRLHQRSCTFQTLSDLTPTWLDLSPTAVSQTREQAKEHHCDITSVRTHLNTSVYIRSQSTQVNFYFYPDRVVTNPTQTLPTIFWSNNRITTIPHFRF